MHGFSAPDAQRSYAPDLALEPTHIEVRMRFDLDAQSATGSVTTTVRANRAGARSLRLDAIGLEGVQIEGADGRYDGEVIHLTWSEGFAAGEERAVTVNYAVRSPITGLHFATPDIVVTDHETERARYWLPCVDYPNVRTTFDFHLTAASDLTILANGLLQSETDMGDGTKTAHWHLDYPCPSYLCCIAIGRFVRVDEGEHGGRAIAHFAPADVAPSDLKATLAGTPRMMEWLEQRLGTEFPFPKYFQFFAPGIGGAMENISLVSWDELFVCDGTSQPEFGWVVESINLHEMSHSYFGDAIVCRHFEHSWLKESWATYMETVWQHDIHGKERGDYDLHRNARLYFGETSRYVRPIVTRKYDSSWDLFDLHLYPGGAWRIHMLRHIVGEDSFWAGVRDYVSSYMGKVVETDAFRHKLEQHSGLNLTRFFDEWIHGRGYPKLKAKFTHDAENGQGKLVVEQTQVDEKRGVRLFSFPLEVRWEDDAGEHTTTLDIEAARSTTVFAIEGQPKQVVLDPASKVLFAAKFNPGDDLLKRTLVEAAEVRVRIAAAEALIETGRGGNLRAVDEAMASEAFWGVRVAVAEALAMAAVGPAAPALAAMLEREEDPMALRSVADACGAFRDERLASALRARLDTPTGPLARASLFASLGQHRVESDTNQLEAALGETSIHDHVRRGALRGLGAMGTRRAWDAIAPLLEPNAVPEMTRLTAAAALGTCGTRLGRRMRNSTVERLIDTTRDSSARVALTAARGLPGLHAAQAIPALEALKLVQPQQEGPTIDRLIAQLRKGPPGSEAEKLREQVEKLEKRCRDLDERLQDLDAKKT